MASMPRCYQVSGNFKSVIEELERSLQTRLPSRITFGWRDGYSIESEKALVLFPRWLPSPSRATGMDPACIPIFQLPPCAIAPRVLRRLRAQSIGCEWNMLHILLFTVTDLPSV